MALPRIMFGDEGPAVGLLQSVLLKTGYYNGEINYVYDNETASALEDWQRAAQITQDGIVGAVTWQSLMPYITGNFLYTVKNGDTLSGIASRSSITQKSLIAANPLVNENELYVGQQILIPFIRSIIPTDLKYSYEIVTVLVAALQQRYPFLATASAGRSVLGNELWTVRLGYGENTVFYNASHHANEWITTPVLLKFIEDFCYAYVNGQTISDFNLSEIYSASSIYLMPLVNPDGVDLVTGALSQQSDAFRYAQSISRENIPFPSGWKANIRGVDLNLNYPAGWQQARENKFALGFSSPAPRDYVGPFPFSEPESRAVGNFTRNIQPRLTLSYHAQGEIIYWKYADFNPPNSYEIALELARQSGYSVEETPFASGFAGYKDWFIQEYNLPGYTIEVGKGVSPLPLSQFDKIYSDNLGLLLYSATA